MAVRLAVDPNEDLDQLIASIKAQSSKEIVLALPQETRALQTLDNFYALRNAVRSAGINLSITGGNKTIRGLAKLLGFAVDKEGGGDDDDDRAREMFGNAPTMASPSAPPTGGERNNTPFGMPDGFFVAGQQGGGAGGGGMATPAQPRNDQPPPMQTRAQDFFNEIQNFDPGIPSTPLQPPPPSRGDLNGGAFGNDQVITRENIPDFFNGGGGQATTSQTPPPPRAEFDFDAGGGRTMSFEEATRSGLFSGASLGGFEPAQLEDTSLADEEVPAPTTSGNTGGDTAADRFRRPRGVRSTEPPEGGKPASRRLRGKEKDREKQQRTVAQIATGAVPSDKGVLNRVKRILVPVQPKAPGTGMVMPRPTQSPEEIRKRNAQRRRTTSLTIIALVALIALVAVLLFLLLKPAGDSGGPAPVALNVPLKTQTQEQTVRLLLVPGGTTGGVSGVTQAGSATQGTTPTVVATAVAASGTPGATAATPTEPAQLPVNLINTGDLKVNSDPTNATATRTVPDKAASGPVTFINRGSSSKGYGAGTVLYTVNGINYRLVDGVTVGAGNVFSGSAGSARGTVVADKAGPAGNVDKSVSRLLSDSVGITLGPITGGTERQEKFVSQTDLDNLKKQLQDKVKAQAASQVKYDQSSEAPLPIKVTDPACDFSKKVNETADTFTGTCTMSMQVAVYNTKTLTDQVKAAFSSSTYKLDENTPVKLLDPQLQDTGTGQLFINVKASGRVIPNLDINSFRDDINNKTKAEALSLIQTKYPQVDTNLLNFDAIAGDTLPPAARLQINPVPDTQVQPTGTVTPSGSTTVSGTAAPTGTSLPSGGNSLPSGTRTPAPTK